MAKDTPGLIQNVKAIADDAQSLLAELNPKAAAGADLNSEQLAAIGSLVERSGAAMSEASVRAKAARREAIAEQERLLESISATLDNPGLPAADRRSMKTQRRRVRSKLLRLRTREGLDFGGILTTPQVEEIHEVLKRARKEVAKKKKAAAFLGSLTRIADLAIGIAAKATPM